MNEVMICIPSLNPDAKLNNTINSLFEAGFSRMILIDDGSDANHKEPFKKAIAEHPEIILLEHTENLGKGRSLKDAFIFISDLAYGTNHFKKKGHAKLIHAGEIGGANHASASAHQTSSANGETDGALTIGELGAQAGGTKNLAPLVGLITADGDGQHVAHDIINVANELLAHPKSVILGCRNFDLPNVPEKSKSGNKSVMKLFKTLFKMEVSDTQTGLRAIPTCHLYDIATKVRGERFEYEMITLTYMHEHGIEIREVEIETVYIEENASTHYRPVIDTIRAGVAIAREVTIVKQWVSSTACSVVDLGLFYVFDTIFNNSALVFQIGGATIIARICSAALNYTLGKVYVFKSKAKVVTSALKYFVTAAIQMLLSWFAVSGVACLLGSDGNPVEGFPRVLIKVCVDVCLFVISFFVQKHWVFKDK